MNYSNGLGNLQNLLGATAAADTRRADATQAAETATTAPTRGADQTQFSSTSGLLGQALSGPDARMPKVMALSASIAAGTYQVSSLDVAGKMVDSLLG